MRQVRRAQKAKASALETNAHEIEEEEETSRSTRGSGFALLQEEGDEDAGSGEDHITNEATDNHDTARKDVSQKSQGRKKGKQKQKKKAKPVNDEDDRLLDDILRGTQRQREASSTFEEGVESNLRIKLLCVDLKSLDAERELKKLFGARTINQENKRHDAARRMGPGRSSRPLKRTCMINPKDYWPRPEPGLSMELIDSMNGCSRFQYVYSASYAEVQTQYIACVQSHDPNTIAQLLAHHPCHVDALLQLSEVYKYSGEMDAAAELLDRALYCFEHAWHPWFKPQLGTSRLDFAVDTNKSFFLALFRRLQLLGRGGCSRTALETCKLLLTLDPDHDPLGALFAIDYYAIRAGEYGYLVDLLQAPAPADRPAAYGAIPLPLLPNMALSAPLAALRSSREAKSALLQDRELWTLAKPLEEKDFKSEQVSALAALSSPAAVLLHRALLLFPSVLQPLATKCDIKTSNEKTGWGAVLKHSHFRGSSWSGPPPTISHLVDLYVERSFSLWKDTEAQQLLLSCATAVSKLVDSNHPCVARCRSAVEAEYPASTPNMYQHLYKGDFSDNLTQLPPMDAPGDAANFFQFGPGHNIPHQHQQEDDADDDAAAAAAVAPYGNPLPIDANALYLLLASLMPWNAPPDGPIPPPPPPPLPPPPTNEEGPGAARNWLDALRDLIGLGNRGMNTANLGTEEGVAGGSTSQAAGQEQGASELESIEDVNEESGEEEGD